MKRRVLVILVFAVWGLLPGTLRAVDDKIINDRIKHLEKLPKVERDRFESNLKLFQSLTDDQKEQFRRLHDELVKDRQQGGTIFAVLETYSRWLHFLSPAQREQLLSETNSAKKMVLVRQFIAENERQLKDERDGSVTDDHDNSRGTATPSNETTVLDFNVRQGNNRPAIQLTKNDLTAIVKVILDDLPPEKKTPELELLPLHQYGTIISESAQSKQNFAAWPEDALHKKILDKLRPPTVKWIKRSELRGETDRTTLVRLILQGIVKNVRDQIPEPVEKELDSTYEKLSANEREKLDRIENTEKRRNVLKDRFFQMKGDDSRKNANECRKNVLELFRQMNIEPPPQMLPRSAPRRDSQSTAKD